MLTMWSADCHVTTGKLQDCHSEGGHDQGFGQKPEQ